MAIMFFYYSLRNFLVGWLALQVCFLFLLLKIARDFNRETACYSRLVVDLGSACDAQLTRDELWRCRRRALDLAQKNKAALLPHLRGSVMHEGACHIETYLWSMVIQVD